VAKVDAKGRNKDRTGRQDAVLIIRRSLWQSPRVSQLSPVGRAIMVELLSLYNGTNNGSLFLSVRDATDRLGFADFRAASAGFEELESAGLISCTIKGFFSIKASAASRATSWRLNWISDTGRQLAAEELPPIDEAALPLRTKKRLERRQRALKRYHRERQEARLAVVETTTINAQAVVETTTATPISVRETTTLAMENGENLRTSDNEETTTHILHHIPNATSDSDDRPVDLIRATVRDWWRVSDNSDRLNVAKINGLAIGELLAFVDGTGDLAFSKAVAVRASVTTRSAAA